MVCWKILEWQYTKLDYLTQLPQPNKACEKANYLLFAIMIDLLILVNGLALCQIESIKAELIIIIRCERFPFETIHAVAQKKRTKTNEQAQLLYS